MRGITKRDFHNVILIWNVKEIELVKTDFVPELIIVINI